MIDLIKSAKTIQKALDKQTLENTTSGWMEENVTQAIYNGGFEIKTPKIDPDIDSSYIACSYETLTLSRGIGKCFHIDELEYAYNDNPDTITLATADVASGDYAKRNHIPEDNRDVVLQTYTDVYDEDYTSYITIYFKDIVESLTGEIIPD